MSNKHNGQKEQESNEKDVSVENPDLKSDIENQEMKEEGQAAGEKDLQKELDTQKDKYLRLFAEFENYKRRTAKEVYDIRQTASLNVISSLLEVMDDIDRAQEQIKESGESNQLLDGIQLIFNKFKKIMELQGLRAIETMYTDFDVEKDEAVSEVPVDDEKLKGKVVAEVQKGYMLNDKLIRFAKVVVGK